MMNAAERRQVVDVAMGTVKKMETIINAGWASTREPLSWRKILKDAGADAVIAVEPFFPPTQEGIARHYRAIASATDQSSLAISRPSRQPDHA
jgi:4-hydroxy-tetrahydrodipicolinate synthase